MSLRSCVLVALGSGLLVMAAASAVAAREAQALGSLTRDPLVLCAEAGALLPWYSGAVSSLTVMVWAGGTALSALVAWLVRRDRLWLALFAGLLALLAADDALELHERVAPPRGVPSAALFLVYAGVGMLLLLLALRRGHRDSTTALLLGGALLAASVLVDEVVGDVYLVEDGAKLLGALVWGTVPLLHLPRGAPAALAAAGRARRARVDVGPSG